MAHLSHDGCLPLVHVGRGVLAAVFERIGQGGGDEGTVGARQGDGSAAEVLLGDCLGTIDAVAHLDAVEIDLHDALLAPYQFDEYGEIDLEALTNP